MRIEFKLGIVKWAIEKKTDGAYLLSIMVAGEPSSKKPENRKPHDWRQLTTKELYRIEAYIAGYTNSRVEKVQNKIKEALKGDI